MPEIGETEAKAQPFQEREPIIQTPQILQQMYGDLYQTLLMSTKKDVRDSLVEFLSNRRWGDMKISKKRMYEVRGKKQEIPYTETASGWVENVKGAPHLMRLEYAIEIANLVADQTGIEFSTSWFDPNTNTLNIAAEIAMVSSHMLDNPRYEFKGNETDSAAFALKVVSTVHTVLNRSIGGFMMKQTSTTTQNIIRHDIREGQDFVQMKENALDKFFGKKPQR